VHATPTHAVDRSRHKSCVRRVMAFSQSRSRASSNTRFASAGVVNQRTSRQLAIELPRPPIRSNRTPPGCASDRGRGESPGSRGSTSSPDGCRSGQGRLPPGIPAGGANVEHPPQKPNSTIVAAYGDVPRPRIVRPQPRLARWSGLFFLGAANGTLTTGSDLPSSSAGGEVEFRKGVLRPGSLEQ
jgi:hypothetical protein